MLKLLLWINGFAAGIILNYCRTIFVKIQALRTGQPQLENRPGNNFEEIQGPEQPFALGGPEEPLMLGAPPTIQSRARARGPRRNPGMNRQYILSSTNTGVRTRTGATVDALMGLRNAPVEDINTIDGGKKRKRKTCKNKRRKTRRFKRGKKRYTRHRRARPTRRR